MRTKDGFARVYRNERRRVRRALDAGLADVMDGAATWADVDADGDADILLTGRAVSGRIAEVRLNEGDGSFSPTTTGLPGIDYGSTAWGDADGDGDLDLLLTGISDSAP